MAHSQDLAESMAMQIAPCNTNPLADKVIHADILVHGMEDVALKNASPSHVEPILLSNEQDMIAQVESEYSGRLQKMQSWWEEAYVKHMKTPDGYAKVAVLLVKWEDEVDDMRTGKEARELEALFRDKFRYTTEMAQIGVRGRPQHQLDLHVSQFIYNHDGPHNLLIIYYTGHGRYHDENKFLEITGSQNPLTGLGFRKDARANWNKVEDRFQDEQVESDVLEILDTCYSSNLVKSSKGGNRKFELLSACFIDQTTASPGNYSFTRALIDALQETLRLYDKNPFSTFTLNERIVKDARRSDTQSHLWSRIHRVQQSGQHILLTPSRPPLAEDSAYRLSPKAYLTLRFGLKDKLLKQEQIELMTHMLSRIVKTVGLRRIDWVDVKPAPEISQFQRVALVLSVVRRWKRVIRTRRVETEAETKRGPPLKRSSEDALGLFDTKRRYLGVEPPSPPISNSSHEV